MNTVWYWSSLYSQIGESGGTGTVGRLPLFPLQLKGVHSCDTCSCKDYDPFSEKPAPHVAMEKASRKIFWHFGFSQRAGSPPENDRDCRCFVKLRDKPSAAEPVLLTWDLTESVVLPGCRNEGSRGWTTRCSWMATAGAIVRKSWFGVKFQQTWSCCIHFFGLAA